MAVDGPDPNAVAPTLARQTGEWHALTLPPGGEAAPAPPPLPVDAVNGYELLGEIGRGGMGVVYRARHIGLNRVVALKMILAGPHARAADQQRFRAEAEAVARLQHPNVVQVYDVGEANGLPFLSLELCAGSLADRLDGTPWPAKPAAELVETLAGAVEAAHQAGVLHRDIKPANVLLASRERERPEELKIANLSVAHAPGSLGLIPKITDFGLAKRLDGSGAGPTVTGAILGTPSYMAPEQAGRTVGDGPPVAPGPTVDVYALGAILYELLTGRPPYLAASPLDTLLQVTRDDPIPPARLNPKTPRDLQTICLKCLEKEPSRRYPTAAALADDLRRYRNDEPITARPAGRWLRAWKWAKRRPAQAALAAVSFTAVIVLLAGSWYFTGQLKTERDNAMQAMHYAELNATAAYENGQRAGVEALNARRRNYVLAVGQAQLAWQSAAVDRVKTLLVAQVPQPGQDNLRGFEWDYWNHVIRGAPRTLQVDDANPELKAITYSPDGKWLAALAGSGRVHIWDANTGLFVRVFETGSNPRCLAFRADGRELAVGSAKQVTLFDPANGKGRWRADMGDWVNGLAYTPDGRLAARAGGQTQLYNAAGRRLRTFARPNLAGGNVVVSPDGRWLAVAGNPGRIYDLETGEVVRDVSAGQAVAISPDGQRLAFVADDWQTGAVELRIAAVDTGRVVSRASAHIEFGAALAYSPDGKYVATAGRDHTVRLWNPSNGAEVRRFQGGARGNTGVAFSPDGQTVAVATDLGTVELWPVDYEQEATTRAAFGIAGTQALALFPQADRVLASGLFGVQVDDVAARRTLKSLAVRSRRHVCGAVSADGLRAAAGFSDGAVTVWDPTTSKVLLSRTNLRYYIAAVVLSADGRRLAAACRADLAADGSAQARPGNAPDRVIVWDVDTGTTICQIEGPDVLQVNALALSADGRRLLTGSGFLIARLWDTETGSLVHTLRTEPGHPNNLGAVTALSPDGRWAAFAHSIRVGSTGDPAVRLYDTATGQLAFRLEGQLRTTRCITFSSDSRRVAAAGFDDVVRLWDVTTGQEVLSRPAPRGVVDLSFSRDGLRLSAVAGDGTLRTWAGD